MDAVEAPQTETNIDMEAARRAVMQDIHDRKMRDDPAYATTFRADYLTARCKRTVSSLALMGAVEQTKLWERREAVKKLKADRDKLLAARSAVSESQR